MASFRRLMDTNQDSLDEKVHERKSNEASNINNDGRFSQIGYLLELDNESLELLEELYETVRRVDFTGSPEYDAWTSVQEAMRTRLPDKLAERFNEPRLAEEAQNILDYFFLTWLMKGLP